MTITEFDRLTAEIHNIKQELLSKKRNDYADNIDVLSNFKRMSALCSCLRVDLSTPVGVAMFFTLLKLDRISNLTYNKVSPKNESIMDTIIDIHNYIDFIYANLVEGGVKK